MRYVETLTLDLGLEERGEVCPKGAAVATEDKILIYLFSGAEIEYVVRPVGPLFEVSRILPLTGSSVIGYFPTEHQAIGFMDRMTSR